MIPVNTPILSGNEKKYLMECIDSGWISSEGPFVTRFEENFASSLDRKYGIAVTNGTSALETAVLALGISPGDEVILPAFTIISCASAIIRAGAKPVLVDSDSTWNMDVSHIEKKVTKKTRAIMAVHIYGLPVEMDSIMRIARKYGLKIIEDSAEMHGQTYKGKPCGSFGDVSVFSFYPNKLITTGEGGMIVTNSKQIAVRCRSLRNLCFIPGKRFYHRELGFNFRMTNLQAALGLAQLERQDEFVQRKRRMGRMYNKMLAGVPGIELQPMKTPYAENIWWVFGIVLNEKVPFSAVEAMKKLHLLGIGTRPFFFPMHQQPVFRKMGLFKNEKYPAAERIARRGFYIPSGLALTDDQMRISAQAVITIMTK